jgi:hypothetical protein
LASSSAGSGQLHAKFRIVLKRKLTRFGRRSKRAYWDITYDQIFPKLEFAGRSETGKNH